MTARRGPLHLGDGRAGGVTGHLDNSVLLLELIDFFALLAEDLLSAGRWVTPATGKAIEDDLLSAAIHQLVITATGCLKLP